MPSCLTGGSAFETVPVVSPLGPALPGLATIAARATIKIANHKTRCGHFGPLLFADILHHPAETNIIGFSQGCETCLAGSSRDAFERLTTIIAINTVS